MKTHCGLSAARRTGWAAFALVAALLPLPAMAQYLAPAQLDGLVSRVALYPDPLLAQVFTASTYYDQIPDAAGWADQHSNLHGDQLAGAIANDNLPWDPSVQALLPFPSVLDNMARDMNWTRQLGDAVLAQRGDVMDAVQRMRRQAYSYGYIRDCPQYRVISNGPILEIVPLAPGALFVPVYDPYRIYAAPRPGFSIGLSFGPRIFIGASFGSFGWRQPGFDWRGRTVIIDNHPWGRTMANRNVYVHEYRTPLAVHPAARYEARPAGRPEVRPEARPLARPEARPEARPAARPEARPAARAAEQKHKDDKKHKEEKRDERR
jgi:hypothetical protein